MVIPFDTMKTVQAAAVLLRQHSGRMSRLRLIKLLYIADRESLSETLHPISGDRAVAMDHGPVLSRTYNLIKREDFESPLWDQYITQEGPQDHGLLTDPGSGKLSRYEIEKLVAVSEAHRTLSDYDIAIETHAFEEWIKNRPARGGAKTIPLADVLAALHIEQYADRLEAEALADAEFDKALVEVRQP